MTSTPFKPYWEPVGGPVNPEQTDPYSWVFFVVAQIAGRHRPIAVVSSLGDNMLDETLQGYRLTAACQRIITIFTDRTNHPAIRAELALAAAYYTRDGNHEYRQEPVELPELNRKYCQLALRRRHWDCTSVWEFPFIAACLLQGVGFDAQEGFTSAAHPEPLGTVYRDTSIEWGMVVVDITNLDAVRYGIVGFPVGQMRFVSSAREERNPPLIHGGFAFIPGELRLVDEVRPRTAMSAAEYIAKFKHSYWIVDNLNNVDDIYSRRDNIKKLLDPIPLIDAVAMDLVWPQKEDILPSLANLLISPPTSNRSLPDEAITNLIQSTFNMENFDVTIFDQVRAIPNFQDLLWRYLVQHSAQLSSSRSAGQLIRLAFDNQEHLGLEQLKNLTAEAISVALGMPEMRKVTSISFCIDSIWSTPAQLVDVLSRADTLQEIYFLQNPTRESDALSAQLFEELAARPQILRRTKVMFAGAYSAALRLRFWLPTIPKGIASNVANIVQVAPLNVFPVQQILARYAHLRTNKIDYKGVYLGDALLKPERFAAGFLIYLHSLVQSWGTANAKAQLFSFSSAPASLAADPLTSAEVSPILAENFAILAQNFAIYAERIAMDNDKCWPRVRDLVPGGWTVVVSLDTHWDIEAARSRDPERHAMSHFIRYAFVRARQQRIVVDPPPLTPPGQDELEVVGLKDFLNATAPEVDLAIIDRRLDDIAKGLVDRPYEGTLPLGIEPISVLSQADAAGILLGGLEDARKVKEHLRALMEEKLE